MKMTFLLWICLVWVEWSQHLATTSLLSISRTYCPFSDFCTKQKGNASFKPTDKTIPCCSPCSCDASCWKLGNCCPDRDVVSHAMSPAYKFHCSIPKYAYGNKPYNTALYRVSYRIVTTCPVGHEDIATVNKCVNSTKFMPESYDDIVIVSDSANHEIIFMNKYCAQCNDVKNIERWTLKVGKCGRKTLAEASMTQSNLYQYIIKECDVSSTPSTNVKLTTNAICSSGMISGCNLTGIWEMYDAEIESACGLSYRPFFYESKYRPSGMQKIYQNAFCYFCNNKVGSHPADVCFNILTGDRHPHGHIPFSAMLDTSLTLLGLEKQHEEISRCSITEIYSKIDGRCRRLYCPVNSSPFNSRCLQNSLDMTGLSVRFKLAIIPTEHFIIDDIDAVLDDKQLQRVGEDVLKQMQLARCDKCGIDGGYLRQLKRGSNNSIYLVLKITISTNSKCELDRIKTSLGQRAKYSRFMLKTKQSTVLSVLNILYYDVDIPNNYLELDSNNSVIFRYRKYYAHCFNYFKISPVFFCPFVTFTEEEYVDFFKAIRVATNKQQHVEAAQSSNTTYVNWMKSKIFRMTTINESVPVKYVTCIEHILSDISNSCAICPNILYVAFVVRIVVAVHIVGTQIFL